MFLKWYLKTLFAGIFLEFLKQLHVLLVCQLVAIDTVTLMQPDAHQFWWCLCTSWGAEQQSLQHNTTTVTVNKSTRAANSVRSTQVCDI